MGIQLHWNGGEKQDKRFLIAVLVFGVLGTIAGGRWISNGSICIREGSASSAKAIPQGRGEVAGVIQKGDALYYPLCASWILLGSCMIALAPLACFTSREIFLRLSAYSCVGILLLAFGTVAAALWYGP